MRLVLSVFSRIIQGLKLKLILKEQSCIVRGAFSAGGTKHKSGQFGRFSM